MTKRLYFTCPIKAIYMMKEFGVEFECQHENFDDKDDGFTEPYFDFRFLEIEQPETIGTLLDYIDNLGRIYVAPESEHIFEPKYWDLGRCFKRNIIANFIDGKWENGTVKFDLKTTKIIMRNNIQFFMPEVENER